MEVRKIAGALGAEVRGVDLAQPLSGDQVAEIRRAWLDHRVIFFRDQNLRPQQFLAFAERFGSSIPYPLGKGIEGFPTIVMLKKLEHERNAFGAIWHSDTVYLKEPPAGTMLMARQVPPYGGDTMFANMVLAYEALSNGMKQMLAGLRAVHSSAKGFVSRTREDGVLEAAPGEYVAEHPVVRTHPETGRKALYVNPAHTVRFSGMTEQESAPMLDFLFRHQTKPEFTCRFVWKPGSLAFWDNRCTQHNPVNDYHGFRRVMLRITLAGDRPR
jgi:taurine dioxygenase